MSFAKQKDKGAVGMENNNHISNEEKTKLEKLINRVLMDTQPTPALFELISFIRKVIE